MRKNPQIRAISSAIARDPEGYSRIPRETFQQVFDRMENEIQHREIEWAVIVEYFTKRGRPLSKDEIHRLAEEDRKARDEEEHRKRQDEEAERRRVARLMEDLENEQNFDNYEAQAAKGDQGAAGKKINFGEDEEAFEDEEGSEGLAEDDENESEGEGYASDPEIGTAKRTYNFKDGGSARRDRAQSAKSRNSRSQVGRSLNERDLRSAKLTTADYIERERSRGGKKGKYGVTVPKPFGFDMREKTKTKSIREKKIDEMVAQKQIEEERVIKHQFRSKPIPPEVLIPRYKTILEANEMRRLEVKKNSLYLTKANERPFSFYERDKLKQQPDPEEYLPYDLKKPHFKANPIPRACSVLIFD